MDPLSLLLTGLAFFIVAVTPGPATISNAVVAMSVGRKTSLVYGAGESTGLVFWGLIAVSGMGAVLQSSVMVLTGLKILGGLYLLWLAFISARAAVNKETNPFTRKPEAQTFLKQWFIRGLVLNISNPKSVLAWMAALSVGVNAQSSLGTLIASFFICVWVGYGVNFMISMLFSIPGMMRGYRRISQWINAAVAAMFALAGLSLLRSALQREAF